MPYSTIVDETNSRVFPFSLLNHGVGDGVAEVALPEPVTSELGHGHPDGAGEVGHERTVFLNQLLGHQILANELVQQQRAGISDTFSVDRFLEISPGVEVEVKLSDVLGEAVGLDDRNDFAGLLPHERRVRSSRRFDGWRIAAWL